SRCLRNRSSDLTEGSTGTRSTSPSRTSSTTTTSAPSSAPPTHRRQAVHIVGRRRWNRRGAMVTDRYQHLHHHEDVESLVAFARAERLEIIAVDNTPGSVRIENTALPRRCVLLFGQEGPGLSAAAQASADIKSVDRPVRVHAVGQRRCRRRHRDAHVGGATRRPSYVLV
ncbi:LOW QUALITY PROTEIN: RNA methyltransferase, partial [Kutzneria sp. 744]